MRFVQRYFEFMNCRISFVSEKNSLTIVSQQYIKRCFVLSNTRI